MKFKHIFMILFFAVVFQILGAQAVLSPEVLKKINGAVFEVVVLKPEEGKLEYEKKTSHGKDSICNTKRQIYSHRNRFFNG